MHRYLQESDRPFFSSGMERDPTMHPFPDVPTLPQYVDYDGTVYSLPPRHISPSVSGFSSSHMSSSVSESEHSPWSSPHVKAATYEPKAVYTESSLHASGGYSSYDCHNGHVPGHCVAMHEVQQYADTQPEVITYEEDHATYGSYAQEGYQPMQEDAHEVVPCVPSQPFEQDMPNGVTATEAAPVIRRRRAQSARSLTSPKSPSKITKRPSPCKRSSSYQANGGDKDNAKANGVSVRAFPCPFTPYGCTSTFGSKNEWKRHVHTQHMRLGFWRCDQCPHGERKPNDFNRKDLFIQHVRRMHPVTVADKKAVARSKSARARGNRCDAEEEVLAEIARRCYRRLRSAPERSGCLFCDQVFSGPGTWDERMEHIGRHMEAGKNSKADTADPTTWQCDEATEEWLLQEQLIVRQRGGLKLA